MSFEISQDIFDIYNSAVDAMIDTNFGVTCTLRYPPEKTECPNCVLNTQSMISTNVYQAGGPIPFSGTFCPYCNGDGFTDSLITENIKLRCYFDKKSWAKLGVDYKLADGSLVAYGHIADMSKILRANEIVINADEAGNGVLTYRLAGSPMPHGFKKNKYFIVPMSRAQ